jgi:CheY-like chemotaxis protein
MPDHPAYSVGTVAQILGTSEAMLRKWEDRYAIVIPERSAAGHRLYSRSQAQQLQFVCDQVAAGRARREAFRLLKDRLANGMPLAGTDEIMPMSRASVLLVDQDRRSADLSEYFLRGEGHEVAVVCTVDQAIVEMGSTTPDLVIIDLLVSDGQGLELCHQLQQQRGIPVLAISTLNLRADAVAAGAAGFLLKPIQPQRLVSVVQHLLSPRMLTTTRASRSPQPPQDDRQSNA